MKNLAKKQADELKKKVDDAFEDWIESGKTKEAWEKWKKLRDQYEELIKELGDALD